MKVPIRWLKEYVEYNLPLAQLVERLALGGLEVSAIKHWGVSPPENLRLGAEEPYPVWNPETIFIGQVSKVDKHPDADRLKLPTVEYGNGKSITMVTGAPNLSVGDKGQKVVLALSGSVLFDGHATPKVLKELKPGKIRGVVSEGMVCSGFELGISEDHEGIIILEEEAPVGMPLVDYFGDSILEVDILPNKARCLSMVGIAREVAALTHGRLKTPSLEISATGPEVSNKVEVEITANTACGRYSAMLAENVQVKDSPNWLKRRLVQCGMRPINNIVDITNYVMLELGQPLHAFDYDVLLKRSGGNKPKITVRFAKAGEKLITLDGQDRELSEDILVIADQKGPIALAGLMGGKDTEVTFNTKSVLLESANFDFLCIRKGMKKLQLPSEAALRFSKGVHPEQVMPAALRACKWMQEIAGASIAKGVVDRYPAPPSPQVIEFSLSKAGRILGIPITAEICEQLLGTLEFKVERLNAEILKITVPGHRLDIQAGAADILEEIARLHGYDHFPATLLSEQLPPPLFDPEMDFERDLKDALARLGLQEAITYSLTSPEAEKPFTNSAATGYVELLNPISSERTVMRNSLIASLVPVTLLNSRHCKEVRLFEVGKVYLKVAGQKLPSEPWKLSLAMTGTRAQETWDGPKEKLPGMDFFDLKGILEGLFAQLHLQDVSFQTGGPACVHPGKSARVMVRKKDAGWFGVMHPKLASQFGFEGFEVLISELDMAALRMGLPERELSKPVSRYPVALRDIAVVVDQAVACDRIQQEMQAAGGGMLQYARLFDIYQGDQIPSGSKSLAFALSYQAPDRTLNDKEVDKLHKKIEDRLKHVLKAQIRGKDA